MKTQISRNRWHILYGNYIGMEKRAVDQMFGLISQYTDCELTVSCHSAVEEGIFRNCDLVIIGTPATNPYIRTLDADGFITVPQKAESYCIRVSQSPYCPENQLIVIAGYDEKGLMYAGYDFENVYLSTKFYTGVHMPGYFIEPFAEKLPEFLSAECPTLENRGLWTWGHVIYDYQKYLENMARLKFNLITIWNEHLPINAKDVVDYAHCLGIRVIWGYSWGWGAEIDLADGAQLEKWKKTVVDTYEQQYADLGGDGIYFQTFTETSDDVANGVVIAEAAVEWVNTIGGALLQRHPDLELQFGLHATSVKNRLEYIKRIDPRISIIWEDCGAFPYAYVPSQLEGYAQTLKLNETVCTLRGKHEKCGAVLKGLVCLDWSNFRKQNGPFVLGCGKRCTQERRRIVRAIWRYVQACWIQNADKAYEMIRSISRNTQGKATVMALVEDGLFEEAITYPVALMAQMLWDDGQDISDLKARAALMTQTVFME